MARDPLAARPFLSIRCLLLGFIDSDIKAALFGGEVLG